MAQGSLPMKFWPDAFATLVYLINKLPTKVLMHKSPTEDLFNIEPNYFSLKTFGYQCFPYLYHTILTS